MLNYKHLSLSLLSGLLLSASWPTYGFAGFIFIGFVPLLLVCRSLRINKPRLWLLKSFMLCYVTFFTFNILTTFWLYYSTAFGMWFAVLVNSALMALVFLFFQFIAKKTAHQNASIFLVALWISFEKLHLLWEFSWPWLNLGNVFSENIHWVQWYEYTGVFGGTLWVWVVNLLAYYTYLGWIKKQKILVLPVVILCLSLLIPVLLSFGIKASQTKTKDSAEIIVLQPNIDPYSEKYDTEDKQISNNLLSLIKQQNPTDSILLLSPETVFADGTLLSNFNRSPAYFFSQKVFLKYPQLSLLTGISMREFIYEESEIKSQTNYYKNGIWFNDYNSAFFMQQNKPVAFYHKSKLVVGVENFPYQGLLKPILGDIMLDLGGTVAMKTTQKERSVFSVNKNVKVAPIICYESVYGEFVTEYVRKGATVLGIITNDAWWDETQGHQQHFSYAKLRAVETRRSVARSANTGISGFINPFGEVIAKTEYNTRTSIKSCVPIQSKITFYVKYGDFIARIALFISLLILVFTFLKHKRAGIKR